MSWHLNEPTVSSSQTPSIASGPDPDGALPARVPLDREDMPVASNANRRHNHPESYDLRMSFSLDGSPLVRPSHCDGCGEAHEAVTGFVLRDRDAYAVYFANWYPHTQEAYIDVVLGTFTEHATGDDRVTFGCRVGHVASQREPAASLVPAGATLSDSAEWGTRLDRTAALEHPRLDDFWLVIDWLILNDPTLHEKVFHMPEAER